MSVGELIEYLQDFPDHETVCFCVKEPETKTYYGVTKSGLMETYNPALSLEIKELARFVGSMDDVEES